MTEHTQPLIVLSGPLTLRGETLVQGDRFDSEAFLKAGAINETNLAQFKRHNYIGPLTRESYAACMKRRPEGEMGQGFTRAELEARGIIDPEPEIVEKKAAKAADPKAPIEAIDLSKAAAIENYKDACIVTEKTGRGGNLTFYSVTNDKGELLRPSKFRDVAKAKAFIDGLAPPTA